MPSKMNSLKGKRSLDAKQLQSVDWRYWVQTRRQLLLAAGLTGLSLVLVLIGAWPQLQRILELRGEISDERVALHNLQSKVSALEEADTLQVVAQQDRINALLPSKKPLLELMSSLDIAARSTQVTLLSIEVRPGEIATNSAETAAATQRSTARRRQAAASTKAYDQLDLDVVVQAQLPEINAFIEQVELQAPICNVTSLALSETPEGFEAEMTISTYFFTQPIAAAVESALPALPATTQQFMTEMASFQYPEITTSSMILGGGQIDLFKTDPLP